ncbi:glucosaminidase domain-containing protein [bacterium]|nr:glucosaminidase domain-containing protein [bacterium]
MKILDFSPGDTSVPPFFNTVLPQDIKKLEAQKKAWVFSAVLLPLILRANNQIIEERVGTTALFKERESLSEEKITQLLAVLKKYKIAQKKRDVEWLKSISEKQHNQILHQINIKIQPISPALTLAQAALESGWGTSRFVRIANNLFGQHTTSARYGIRPKYWTGGHNQNIKIFSSVCDSIAAYMLNLNRNQAYKSYRTIRFKHPAKPQFHIYGFEKYSEIGEEYIKRLKTMLYHYKFIAYTNATLDTPERLERLSQLKSFYIY